MLIDGLQYCNWSEKIFRELRNSNVTAIHVTISYHEQFRETVSNFEQWNKWFEKYPSLIMPAYFAEDVEQAKKLNKTAIIFGFQNPASIEDLLDLFFEIQFPTIISVSPVVSGLNGHVGYISAVSIKLIPDATDSSN